jgi:hypothetical protein
MKNTTGIYFHSPSHLPFVCEAPVVWGMEVWICDHTTVLTAYIVFSLPVIDGMYRGWQSPDFSTIFDSRHKEKRWLCILWKYAYSATAWLCILLNMHIRYRHDYAYFRNMHIQECFDYAYHRNMHICRISTINMCVWSQVPMTRFMVGASTPVSGITVLLYHYTLFWSSVWSQDCIVSVQGRSTGTLSEGSEDIIP